MMAASRLENVTQTIARILEGYDIRLRPNFASINCIKLIIFSVLLFFAVETLNLRDDNMNNDLLSLIIQCRHGKRNHFRTEIL